MTKTEENQNLPDVETEASNYFQVLNTGTTATSTSNDSTNKGSEDNSLDQNIGAGALRMGVSSPNTQ